MDKFSELKAAAMAATPGRIGDRIDGSGSIKYECTGYDGSLVLRTDHKDMEYGFVGDNADADELFFRLCVPDVVLELLAENERFARELVARNGEIEGLKKRASELEAHNARLREWNAGLAQESCELQAKQEAVKSDASQVFKEIGNELGCNPDNESIMAAIDELKERLATPVRLPNKSDDEFWFDGVFQVAKFDRAVERAISAAGFKFVGDE
ncbi:TPA: ead/Ea22-like family protein [Serratia marcescens]